MRFFYKWPPKDQEAYLPTPLLLHIVTKAEKYLILLRCGRKKKIEKFFQFHKSSQWMTNFSVSWVPDKLITKLSKKFAQKLKTKFSPKLTSKSSPKLTLKLSLKLCQGISHAKTSRLLISNIVRLPKTYQP